MRTWGLCPRVHEDKIAYPVCPETRHSKYVFMPSVEGKGWRFKSVRSKWPGAINHALLLYRVVYIGAWTWASLCTWPELKGETKRKHLQKKTSLSESFPSVIFIAE